MNALLDLADFGWDQLWSSAASAYLGVGVPGRISRVDRGLCVVLTAAGPLRASLGAAVLETMVADTLAAPCTGDWCIVRHWPDGPATVEVVLPRRTAVIRAEASGTSRGQVLATNVDLAVVVVSLQPDPRLARIERLLALAWESGARPVVILSKADMVNDSDAVADDVRELAQDAEVLCTSTTTRRGIDALRAVIGTRSSAALLGASGHGKSSLANALVGVDAVLTTRIRDDGKGRHTSVRRELLLLPGGGAVIDTPGLRGVGLQESEAGIRSTFPDIVALASSCRFADCGHLHEPGCSVLAAVESGTLRVRRLDSWRALQAEQTEMTTRAELRLRRHAGKGRKFLSKQQRALQRRRP